MNYHVPLSTIADAAHVLQQAIDIPVAYIAVTPDQKAIVLRAPILRSMDIILTFCVASDGDYMVKVYTPIPGGERTFKYTKMNLLGFLGDEDLATILDTPVNNVPGDWMDNQHIGRRTLQWTKTSNGNVFVSEPLGTRSNDPDVLLRNKKSPFQRIKVFCDGRTGEWTFAVVAHNGRDLGPAIGRYTTGDIAIAAAELHARENNLPPTGTAVAHRGVRVLHYFLWWEPPVSKGGRGVTATMHVSEGSTLRGDGQTPVEALRAVNDQFRALAKQPGKQPALTPRLSTDP